MKLKNLTLTVIKQTLNSCARDPRTSPYNVIADTTTPDYLIQNSILELRGENGQTAQTLRSVICNLALALAKIERENDS